MQREFQNDARCLLFLASAAGFPALNIRLEALLRRTESLIMNSLGAKRLRKFRRELNNWP